ncbi:DUF262 domain-containing protein [Enterococcus sp. DIV0242_7C1]|uniref:GmrSD restriction endonucleases N-terminal domain-containing protein n=1 Tax=Candidatus Enterococcus dunnyi TaxID=1834192 RepID=A0AAQ3W8N1_9ENTE|nr:DUF262 domain-containing protein [Enterococcus sp. DIV0242_7C1]MBO0469697.1 DUF262 domain-containing protein [Enterococcus sp. DIV0242_7C1]
MKYANDDSLQAHDFTIKEYLEQEGKWIIPRYQRDYSWDKNNVSQFINDIISNNEKYYLGNIIIVQSDKEYEVIDGQQRLITTFLCLLSLYKKFKSNDSEHQKIKEVIFTKNNLKLNIEQRISNSKRDILKALENEHPSVDEKNANEFKMFKEINKKIDLLDITEKKSLVNKILSAKIVEIKFYKNESKAHDMFVNLNTKGKPLNELDIIKSQLFRYLSDDGNDKYKENWQTMLQLLSTDRLQKRYIRDIAILYNSNKLRKSKNRGNLSIVMNHITDRQSANNLFSYMTEINEGCLLGFFNAVKKHDLSLISSILNLPPNVSLQSLNEIWTFFGEINFEQFDIIMMSILFIDNKQKKVHLKKNVTLIKSFLKLIFIVQILYAINKVSPSTYANSFDEVGFSIYSKQTSIRDGIRFFINERMQISAIDDNYIRTTLESMECFEKKQHTKFAKLLIQLLSQDYRTDLTADHFVSQANIKNNHDIENKELIKSLGNIVPVSNDCYRDMSPLLKYHEYKKNRSNELFINNFLNDVSEKEVHDCLFQRIELRRDNFITQIINLFDKLKEEILKETNR